MKTIPLTQGQVALVDDEDYAALAKFKWFAQGGKRTFKARRKSRDDSGKKISIWMHREILQVPEEVDHKDGNGLNNQRYNLRPSTRLQNQWSFQSKRAGCSSKFRGVWKVRSRWTGKLGWASSIGVVGVKHYLGHFYTEIEAALAYDAAAKHYFKDRAHVNFP